MILFVFNLNYLYLILIEKSLFACPYKMAFKVQCSKHIMDGGNSHKSTKHKPILYQVAAPVYSVVQTNHTDSLINVATPQNELAGIGMWLTHKTVMGARIQSRNVTLMGGLFLAPFIRI